jgi:hypothetical protein
MPFGASGDDAGLDELTIIHGALVFFHRKFVEDENNKPSLRDMSLESIISIKARYQSMTVKTEQVIKKIYHGKSILS